MTPEEKAFRLKFLDAFSQYLPTLQGRAGETGGQLFGDVSPEARQLAALLSGRAAQPPRIAFEDTFNPEFQLAKDQVAAFANQRGITGSGLELEKLGRAGIDLAIKQAAARQQNALLNQQLQEQTLSDLGGLVSSQSGLSDQARSELMNYLSQGMGYGEAFRGRQAQGVVQAQTAAQPYFTSSIDALQNRMNQNRELVMNIGKAVGGIALAPFTGGMSLAAAIPTSFGSPGYHGAGYANYPQLYGQLYGQQPAQTNSLASYLSNFRGGV